MGLGCNAAGVTGCRIIDSPRERLIAMLTNVCIPCNGRFPAMITILTLFFAASLGWGSSLTAAIGILCLLLLGTGMTFLLSFLLSHTLLKGIPSSFTLELPPYRKPQIGKVLIRSVCDRTLFVLGRACMVAAPAGMIGASNFFGLAVAVAIALFGTTSPAALATTVGVLTEVPVMLFLVKIANKTKGRFPA